MGALPKQRISRMRRGDRRSHDHLNPIQLVDCPQCHQMKLPHHVCPTCGTYNGYTVLEMTEKKKKEEK